MCLKREGLYGNVCEDSVPKIQIKICRDPLQVDAQAWDDLVLRSAGGHVFQTCEWMLSWWEVYGAQKKLSWLCS